ncbi:complement inhibitor CirpT4-like [Haemaphysalis longicornis]
MMRSRVPVLVVVFAFLGMNWPQSTAYVGRANVEVVDGHCIFQNHTLRHHESIQLENPCQGWFCDAHAGIISIGGCTPHWIPDNCFEVDGNGTYPQCCPQLRCNKTEEAH